MKAASMLVLSYLAPERNTRRTSTLDPALQLQVPPGTAERSECNGSKKFEYKMLRARVFRRKTDKEMHIVL
jgi:hypothetical protein